MIRELRIDIEDLEDFLDMATKQTYAIICSCPEAYFDTVNGIQSKHENYRNIFVSFGRKEDASSGMWRDEDKHKRKQSTTTTMVNVI